MPSVLWRCWLGGMKGIRPVKTERWGADVVICLERDADLLQLMPLPLTVSCFSKIQIGSTFLVPADPGSPGQRAVKRTSVCVCVVCICMMLVFRPSARPIDGAGCIMFMTFPCVCVCLCASGWPYVLPRPVCHPLLVTFLLFNIIIVQCHNHRGSTGNETWSHRYRRSARWPLENKLNVWWAQVLHTEI